MMDIICETCLDKKDQTDNPFVKLFTRLIKNDRGRLKILNVVRFKNAIKFDYGLSFFKKDLIHIGSGSYAIVFRSNGYILKFIRLLPEMVMDRIHVSTISNTTSYFDAYNEYQISYALSRLEQKSINYLNQRYSCRTFPKIKCSYLINDDILSEIKQKTSSSFKKTIGNFNDIFEDYFCTIPRENLVIVMDDCGILLADVINRLSPPYVLLSILKQIIIGLMIAEQALEFEHRDLHSGNILLQPCSNDFINFKYDNNQISIPSYGHWVKIIDTTFSRLKYRNQIFYKDMTYLFENFDDQNKEFSTEEKNLKNRRMQDVTYGKMAKVINNDWKSFHPKTNVLWIEYVIYKMKKSLNQKHQNCDQVCVVIEVLERYNHFVKKCSSLHELFQQMIMNENRLNDLVKISIRI